MTILASSYKGAAGAQAMSRGMSPERFAERSAAYAAKEQSDQQLEQLQKTKPTDEDYSKISEINSQKLDQALMQLDQTKKEFNLKMSYDAFQRYDNDGYNIKHLNQLYTDLAKRGSQLYGNIARVDRINTTDIPMMEQTGLNKALQNEILNNPEVSASYVKITAKDGTVSFGDVDALKAAATGYNDYASEKELARQTTVRQIEYLTSIGLPTDANSREAFRAARARLPDADAQSPEFQEEYQKRLEELKASRSRAHGGNATELEQRVLDVLEMEDLYPGDEGYIERKVELTRELEDYKKRPSSLRSLEKAEEAQNELAEMPFFNQKGEETQITREDLSRSEELNIENKIRILEQAGDQKLDTETRKALMQIKELAHLGGKASELTEEETGFWDNFIFRAKKYFTNDVTGIEAASAFAEYSNLNRHALFGSVLPAAEISSHIQSFGLLGLQQGPILEHLRGSVEKLKNNYESLASMNNPLVFEWRSGMTELELDNTIIRLERQLSEIDAVMNDTVRQTAEAPNIRPDNTAVLLPEWREKFEASYPGDKE